MSIKLQLSATLYVNNSWELYFLLFTVRSCFLLRLPLHTVVDKTYHSTDMIGSLIEEERKLDILLIIMTVDLSTQKLWDLPNSTYVPHLTVLKQFTAEAMSAIGDGKCSYKISWGLEIGVKKHKLTSDNKWSTTHDDMCLVTDKFKSLIRQFVCIHVLGCHVVSCPTGSVCVPAGVSWCRWFSQVTDTDGVLYYVQSFGIKISY